MSSTTGGQPSKNMVNLAGTCAVVAADFSHARI